MNEIGRATPPALLATIKEAAESLHISRGTLYGLIRGGRLPVVRIGRSIRIPLAALEGFAGGRLPAMPPPIHQRSAGLPR